MKKAQYASAEYAKIEAVAKKLYRDDANSIFKYSNYPDWDDLHREEQIQYRNKAIAWLNFIRLVEASHSD